MSNTKRQYSDNDAQNAALDFLAGGGEMAKLIREKDWSKTPLGPIAGWSQALRTTVSLALNSNFPINIIWGPERVQIYNDGYWIICGDKHPHSMGQDYRECWFSAWDALRVPFENASGGQTDFLINQRMFLDRNGYLEETFFTFSLSPIRDETGNIGGLFHPVTELTQQTLAERRLKVVRDLADDTNEAKTVAQAGRLITESLADDSLDLPFMLLYLLDAEGKTAHLAGSTGLTPDSAAAPPIITIDDPAQPWQLAQATRERQIIELNELEKQFGQMLVCPPYPESVREAFVLPINASGLQHPIGLLIAGVSPRRELDAPYRTFYQMLRDGVTNALTNARAYEEERKRAEALAEIDRAKTVFFSNVSHEFRTPLTLMLGPVEEMLTYSDAELSPMAKGQLELVNRNGRRLLRLVNTLLDFSRIEAGRIRATYQPTDLAAYTADLASVFRAAIERAEMRLLVTCEALLQPIYVDREMWEQIVLNLISNAFKFTLAGEIEVGLRSQDDFAVLTVRDTGIGVAPAEMPRLFERFHRVENALGRTHEGSGIGLALVQELVRLHGGEIAAESEFGRGTTFTIKLPFGCMHLPADQISQVGGNNAVPLPTGSNPFVEEARRWLPEEDEQWSIASGQNLENESLTTDDRSPIIATARILVADDNADMRHYVAGLLSTQYTVQTVADGQKAIEAARENLPDLVLADVMMPRLDGFGLLNALRADERTRDIPIIMLSARAGEEARVEGLQAGADDYLTKPFKARELVARVGSLLMLTKMRQAHKKYLEERDARRAALNLMEDAIQAKEALRQSEEKYRTLFNSMDEGYAVVEVMADDNGEWNDFLFLEVNPAFERQTGMVNSVGRTATQILGTPNPAWAQIYGRVAQTGESIRFEEREETLDRTFDLYTFRLGEAGSRHVAVLFTDITDRKRREANLAFLAEIQNDCARLTTSDEIMQTVGAKIGSYLHLSMCDFVDIDEARDRAIVHHTWHREDAPNLIGTYRISEFVTEAFHAAVWDGDIIIVNDTNTDARIHAENYAALSIQAVIHVPLLREGQWKFLFNGYNSRSRQWREDEIELFRELANQIFPRLERARAEEAVAADLQATQLLRELGARLLTEDNIQKLYQEIISAAIALTHADAGTVQILDNATQELVLLTTQGFDGTMTERFHRVDASSNTSCGITLKNGIRSFVNFDVPQSEDPDGSMQMHVELGYLSAQSTPLITRSGRGIGMFSTHWRKQHRPSDRELRFLDLLARQAADLIEQRQTEAERDRLLQQAQAAWKEAEQANRIKDEFLAVLSHELRTPLNPILGWSKLLQNGKLDAAKTAQALTTIERNAKLQAKLIEDLLDVSRILRGKFSLNVSPIHLASTIRGAIETVRLAAEAKSIEVEANLDAEVGQVSGDSTRLQQVVWNLLSNAVKFTPAGGLVEVRLERVDHQAQITVRDNGKGIPANFLPYVFDYFRQEDGATTRQFGGLGLGLAIVRHLVELHGGTVEVASAGEGLGATFTIKLPLLKRQGDGEMEGWGENPPFTPSSTLPLTGLQILVIDDETDSRDFVAFVLEQAGASVTTASTASAGLVALTQSPPDVLLSDIGMPEMDGYMLIRQVRRLAPEQGGQVKAIALTAYARDFDQQKAFQSGFQAHITKPLEPDMLIKTIIRLLCSNNL